MNPLYLVILSATGHFKEKTVKNTCLLIRQRNTNRFFLELDQKLKHSIVAKNGFMKKNYAIIGVNTGDGLPLNKALKFPMLTIIITCIFQEDAKLYPQIYLDESLHELVV